MGRLEKIRILNSLLLEEMPEYRQQTERFAEDMESQGAAAPKPDECALSRKAPEPGIPAPAG